MIRIERYETEIVGSANKPEVAYYAVAGKKRYPMPSCYAEMYNDKHLAITERKMEMPELYDMPEDQATHYIPLRTSL